MKKYSIIMIVVLMSLLVISSVVYGWFTYVQRKSISTFVSNELTVNITLNEDEIIDTKTLSNLAFIDFEDDLLLNTNNAFNEVGQVMDIKITLDETSPLSRFIFELGVIDDPLIYLIVLDDQIIDYHQYINLVINPLDTKANMLLSIDAFNQSQIDLLSSTIVLPGEIKTFKVIFWADYDQLVSPDDYLTYTTNFSIKLTMINAYGELS